MAVFPRIQRSCPYKSQLAAAMDGDICRICDHQVVDLTDWSDDERIAFVASRKEDVCISYRLPLRPALAAAALAAAALPTMAAAQDSAAPPATQAPADDMETNDIVGVFSIGAIKDPANTMFATAEELAARPEVPVAYEDESPAEPPAPPAPPADPR